MMTAGQARDILAIRMRDFARVAYPDAVVFNALMLAMRLVNARHRLTLRIGTFPTAPYRCIYNVTANFPNMMRVVYVREGERDLTFVPWRSLAQYDKFWFRRTGTRYESWSLLGVDQLIVYPAREVGSVVTVLGTRLVPFIASAADTLEFRDEDIPIALRFAELILLTRGRFLRNVPALTAFLKELGMIEEGAASKKAPIA